MKTLKKIATVLAMTAALTAALAACSKVPTGNVGVKVYLLGSSKGVDVEELTPGRYWIGINEELYLFPTFTQNYTWEWAVSNPDKKDESISFQTREGLVVNADVGVSYAVAPEKVSTIFQKYRKGIDEITDVYLRNMVRDALVTEGSTRAVETVYGSGKSDLMASVEKRVRSQVEPLGIQIERIYWIGELRLPQQVMASLNAKIEATQRAQQRQNEVAEAEAEADKKVAEAEGEAKSIVLKANAEAEANKIVSQSLTPELVQYRALERWTGELPRITGGGVVPFVNVDGITQGAK